MAVSLPAGLAEALDGLLESWMDVALIGVSPEAVPATRQPSSLTAMRVGAGAPRRPFDLICARSEPAHLQPTLSTACRALETLRLGGTFALFLQTAGPEVGREATEQLQPHLEALDVAAVGQDLLLLTGHKPDAGATDLVGLRRALAGLESHISRLEHWAEHQEGDAGPATKLAVGQLADADRDGYLARALAARDQAAIPPFDRQALSDARHHDARELAELVTRFRHFRHLSLETLRAFEEGAWTARTETLDGEPTTLSGMIRAWVRLEADAIETLETRTQRAP